MLPHIVKKFYHLFSNKKLNKGDDMLLRIVIFFSSFSNIKLNKGDDIMLPCIVIFFTIFFKHKAQQRREYYVTTYSDIIGCHCHFSNKKLNKGDNLISITITIITKCLCF